MDRIVPSELDLVSTEELINMLMSRCTNAIFIGMKPEQYAPNNYWYEMKGERITCTGLWDEMEILLDNWREDCVRKAKDEE